MKKTIFFQSCVGVFQGGGCRAAALVGAYEEAVQRGVHFVEVAGTSAGSIIAGLIGAGATTQQLNEFVSELNFQKFLMPPDIENNPSWLLRFAAKPFGKYGNLLLHQGYYSSSEIEVWVESCLRKLLGTKQGPITFSDLQLPTSIVATDILSRKVRVWNNRSSPNDSVAKAIRASCSIPIFFQPVNRQFIDGGVLSNLPTFLFAEGAAGKALSSRILAFVLKADDESIEQWNSSSLLDAVVNTVVEGSQELQLTIQGDVHVVSIPTGNVKATDFDKMDTKTIAGLIKAGKKASEDFFNTELVRMKTPKMPSDVCYDLEDLYGDITQHLETSVTDLLICENDTDFVYSLFPSLLVWRMRDVHCRIMLSKIEPKFDHGAYRRRLLRALGAEVIEVDNLPYRGYFINCHDPSQGSAYVALRSGGQKNKIEAVKYEGAIHAAAISALYGQIRTLFADSFLEKLPLPSLVAHSQEDLLRRLQTVSQYGKNGVQLTFESVKLSNLVSLTQYVREYKYRQIQHLIAAYEANKVQLFDSVAVNLLGGLKSIVTPPVVEEAGDGKYVLIEGSTRATFLRDRGDERFNCIVVRSLKDPLPSATTEFKKVQVAGRSLDVDFRYGELNYNLFRHIERQIHPLNGP